MKKCGLILLSLIIFSLILSACKTPSNSTIKYERKLGKYFDKTENTSGRMVDLSEGPKLQYDAKFGPRDLNFDIKIVNPY